MRKMLKLEEILVINCSKSRDHFQYLSLTCFLNLSFLKKTAREKVLKMKNIILKTDGLRDASMVQFELFKSLKIVKIVKITLQKGDFFMGQNFVFGTKGDWGLPQQVDCGTEIAEQ